MAQEQFICPGKNCEEYQSLKGTIEKEIASIRGSITQLNKHVNDIDIDSRLWHQESDLKLKDLSNDIKNKTNSTMFVNILCSIILLLAAWWIQDSVSDRNKYFEKKLDKVESDINVYKNTTERLDDSFDPYKNQVDQNTRKLLKMENGK